jgi:hypothetical protein
MVVKDVKSEEIYKSYKELGSLKNTAKKYGCSLSGIHKYLSSKNYKLNKKGAEAKYTFDNDFFKYNSEKSLYWAGFLAADGSLIKKENSYLLQLDLANKDLNHLIKFKNDINFNGTIYNITRGKTKSNCIKIYLQNNTIKDLKKFNIYENKTLNYIFPEWLKNHKLSHHFMRGYFDGDGCIHITKKKQLSFSIIGTYKFLKMYKLILEKELFINYNKISKHKSIYQLSYGGNKQVPKIMNYLYKDANIYLARKYDIYNEFIKFIE